MGLKKLDKNLIIKMYGDGKSMSEIARRLNTHHGCIAYHLHKTNTPTRKVYLRNPLIKTEDIVKSYLSGDSITEIAERVGISYQSISLRLFRANIKMRKHGETLKEMIKKGRIKIKSGKDSHMWKGGISLNKKGYVVIRIDKKETLEHRYVWEKHHGKLPKNWLVHHLNGVRNDNRIENLQAMPKERHNSMLQFEPYKKRILELENKLKED